MTSDQRVDGARLSSASWLDGGRGCAAEAGASVTRESQTASVVEAGTTCLQAAAGVPEQ